VRLQKLQLLRYGKFTDAEMALPQAAHDFHFIVGPNEAGKSTVRGAIADLLFGFPTRAAAMAFLHPQPDLRLAAQVTDGDEQLSFTRIKAAKNTLRSATDAVLPADALAPFLGTADRSFFEKMFGLDHAQLVAGGETILDASKDVSQVLFQSAAGIAGLGKVKEALLAEADRLWAPRYAAGRSYYAASDRFEAATKDLKAVTVRAKAWSDAREALDDVQGRIAAAQARKTSLQQSRGRLERVRRLAPTVHALRLKLADLQALGEVMELPANAAEVLSTGASALSVAQTVLQQCTMAVEQLTIQRDGAAYDATVLAGKGDIEALAAFGERVRDHEADLVARRSELARHLGLARAAGAELGWPDEEATLRARLPTVLVLRDLQRLVTAHAGLLAARVAALEAADAKQAELDTAAAVLQQTAGGEVPASLRGAMLEAQGHRHTAAQQARLAAAASAAERALEAALSGLGGGPREIALLQEMPVPSAQRLSALLAGQQLLESEQRTAADQVDEAQRALDDARLQARQFAEARRIVTGAEVRQARGQRDAEWQSIKAGHTPLSVGAAGLDAAIALADELVDTQLASATEAAQLQSLRQLVERAAAELEARRQSLQRKASERAAADQAWQALSTALGLPGLALPDAQAWMNRREQVLAAAAARDEKQADLRQEVDAARAAAAALSCQLEQAGVAVPAGSTLAASLVQAESWVADRDQAQARRAQLQQQWDAARAALNRLQAAAQAATSNYQAWEAQWDGAVKAAGLSDYMRSVADAEHALGRVETVRQNLDHAAATQRDRIDTMNRDLAQFEAAAQALVDALGAVELKGATARQVVRALSPRLAEAIAGQARRTAAEDALHSAHERHAQAQRELALVQAQVAPLLLAAGVDTLADAAPLVEQWDRRHRLLEEIAQARSTLAQGADGLGLDAVMAEVERGDLLQVATDLSNTDEALEQVQTELTRLAEERWRAEQAVQAIGGGSDAAAAESRRQEALAGMADASERYIQVTAAAKLLTWAIDRYREQNQGPMLSRAGAVFAILTLNRYGRLFVDYDKSTPSLSALRTDGAVVEVSGLSEGTRDQLYLALRLAALELHLGQSKPLPFVADDLFINFDDERSTAGLQALRELSTQTQVLFLSHHDHLLPRVRQVFGAGVNVVQLQR
jgi:uncharacterized protein YhaN